MGDVTKFSSFEHAMEEARIWRYRALFLVDAAASRQRPMFQILTKFRDPDYCKRQAKLAVEAARRIRKGSK